MLTTNVEKSGAQVVKARAVLEDAHTLRLSDGKKITAQTILIATGGRPNHGPGNSRHRARDLFRRRLPPHRAAQAYRGPGGGYIALEFAGIFNGWGAT